MHGQQPLDRDFHALYSGSMIHRLLAGCAGSVRLGLTAPPAPPNKWQIEGTEAHHELELALRHTPHTERKHFQSIQHVIDYVTAIGKPYTVHTEHRVYFPQSIVPREQASGTLDVMVVKDRQVWIIDYKHGAGEYVAAEENAQLMFYAWAALHHRLGDFDDITLVIIQPNSWQESVFPQPREYKTSALELFDFARAVERAITAAEQLHAPLVPGDHCRFCPAAPVCTARERTALAVMAGDDTQRVRDWQPASLPEPGMIDLGRLGDIVVKAPAIRAWLKSVEDYAEARALAGEIEVPGCKIVEAPARRKWAIEPHDPSVFGLMNAVAAQAFPKLPTAQARDYVAPRKLIGITEAEKLVIEAATRGLTDAAEKREAVARAREAFSALTVKESSGALSLVPLSDPRPPVNRAAKHFGGVIVKGLPE